MARHSLLTRNHHKKIILHITSSPFQAIFDSHSSLQSKSHIVPIRLFFFLLKCELKEKKSMSSSLIYPLVSFGVCLSFVKGGDFFIFTSVIREFNSSKEAALFRVPKSS